MANLVKKPTFSALPLDTLGQVPTNSLKNLQKRARSKWYTSLIVGNLLFLDSPLNKYYQRAFYCSHILTQTGTKITTKYCDTRVCHICNRIRTAKLMKGYVDQLKSLGELEFVTLTLPNCQAFQLRSVVDGMIKDASLIVRVLRERKGINLSGIRKLEVTYNSDSDSYHPHFHFLVTKGHGEYIVDQWLQRIPKAKRVAQDITPADQNSLNELFKYTTKIERRKGTNITVYIPAIDTILQALRGRRCFQPFGKIKKVDEELTDLEAEDYEGIPEYELIEWIWKECDWVNGRSTLTGYVPPEIEIDFVE